MATCRQSVRDCMHACDVLLKSPELSDPELLAVQDMARRLSEEMNSSEEETALNCPARCFSVAYLCAHPVRRGGNRGKDCEYYSTAGETFRAKIVPANTSLFNASSNICSSETLRCSAASHFAISFCCS
jgi:hypothetical protein